VAAISSKISPRTAGGRTTAARRAVPAVRAGGGRRSSAPISTAAVNVATYRATHDAGVAFEPSASAPDRLQQVAAAIGCTPQLISVEPAADPFDRHTRHAPTIARPAHVVRQ